MTRLKRRYRDTKSVKPKPHGGGQKRRISREQEPLVEALVRQHPDWTEDQYAEALLNARGAGLLITAEVVRSAAQAKTLALMGFDRGGGPFAEAGLRGT